MSTEATPAAVSVGGILNALDPAAVLFDDRGVLRYANDHALQLVGLPRERVLGLSAAGWEAALRARLAPVPALREDGGDRAQDEEVSVDKCAHWESRGYPRTVYERSSHPVREPAENGSHPEGGSPVERAACPGWRLDILRERTLLARCEAELARETERHVRELERLTSRQAQAERFQLELTANVTHDLKTPIASIKASVSGLLAGDVSYDPQALRETLCVIEQEADRLQRRVQNLLSLAQMESGDAPLHRDWVDITDVIATACESLKSAQGARGLRLHLPEDVPLVQADYEQLLNATRNLLENSYLYSPPEEPVEITVGVSLGQLRVRIRDYGQGLMPDEFERIFDKFYRGRSARRIPGTGLGLPICRRIAAAHGGRLWAEHAPGGGVAFVLSIPVETLPIPPSMEEPSDEQNSHSGDR